MSHALENTQQSYFPLSQKGYHCSLLMGQLGDILRMSLPPICAVISILYLKSQECFVVKVNLIGGEKQKKKKTTSASGFVPVTIQRET